MILVNKRHNFVNCARVFPVARNCGAE